LLFSIIHLQQNQTMDSSGRTSLIYGCPYWKRNQSRFSSCEILQFRGFHQLLLVICLM
jgi:hypothetical protein